MNNFCPTCGHEIPPIATSSIEKYPNGEIKKWIETVKDSKGVLIGKREDSFSYFETGEVKEIVQKRYDKDDILFCCKKVLHTKDGKNPTVQDVDIEEEVPE